MNLQSLNTRSLNAVHIHWLDVEDSTWTWELEEPIAQIPIQAIVEDPVWTWEVEDVSLENLITIFDLFWVFTPEEILTVSPTHKMGVPDIEFQFDPETIDAVVHSVMEPEEVDWPWAVETVSATPTHKLSCQEVNWAWSVETLTASLRHQMALEDSVWKIDPETLTVSDQIRVLQPAEAYWQWSNETIWLGIPPTLCLALPASRTPDGGVKVDQSEDGQPRSRTFYDQTTYNFRLRWEFLSYDVAIQFEKVYQTNLAEEFNYVYPADGRSYIVMFKDEPSLIPGAGDYWTVEAELVGRLA